MIKLYTLPTCGICKMVKAKLTAKHLDYEEYNLEDYINELHTDRAPVLITDDNLILQTPLEINNWIKEME